MSNQHPIIGILTNLFTVEQGLFCGLERVYVNRNYVQCITDTGGVPLLLPIVSDLAVIRRQIESIDALLLTGGQDVDPLHYGEDRSSHLRSICLERDYFELAAIKHAFALKKPIFGICRGLQLINIAFGGSLYQDIKQEHAGEALNHFQENKRDETAHLININTESKLFSVLQTAQFKTNSFHHQAIKEVAPRFTVNAYSDDGIIEGIEFTDEPYVMGVQWHPEIMKDKHPEMLKLFYAFVCAAFQTSCFSGETA